MYARLASCDVTPRDRPVQLAGYASRKGTVSKVLDPIEISALLLECDEQRCLIFSFDLLIVGSELQSQILARLRQLGFGTREIVLLASHTHCAPGTDQASIRLGTPDLGFVEDVAAATESLVLQIQRMKPRQFNLEVRQGELDHSINRRRYWPFPTWGRTHGFRLTSTVLAPNPSGPTNEIATVMVLRQVDDGRPLGVIWHYTCHPTAVVLDDVISADYPGAVRSALREEFGTIPCIFLQGFCGDTRPNIPSSEHSIPLRKRLMKVARTVASGPTFPTPTVDDWLRWSKRLTAGVCGIATCRDGNTFSQNRLQTGFAKIPLGDFFEGITPDKMLVSQIVRFGHEFEVVALSAEASIGWQHILDQAFPIPSGRVRLYAGYLGALFGYLPTPAQVPQGGYEVDGFQALFGLSGHFQADQIGPAIVRCVGQAFEDLERAERQSTT